MSYNSKRTGKEIDDLLDKIPEKKVYVLDVVGYDFTITDEEFEKLYNADFVIVNWEVTSGAGIYESIIMSRVEKDTNYYTGLGIFPRHNDVIYRISLHINNNIGTLADYMYNLVSIFDLEEKSNKTYVATADGYGEAWTAPKPGTDTPGVPVLIYGNYDGSYPRDGDSLMLQIPTTLTNTLTYPLYFTFDEYTYIRVVRGQKDGVSQNWAANTTLTNGYYHFVYSANEHAWIYITRNTSTSG